MRLSPTVSSRFAISRPGLVAASRLLAGAQTGCAHSSHSSLYTPRPRAPRRPGTDGRPLPSWPPTAASSAVERIKCHYCRTEQILLTATDHQRRATGQRTELQILSGGEVSLSAGGGGAL